MIEFFELMSEACGVPTGEFTCARGDLSDRNEARASIWPGFVWYEVCDGNPVSGNCEVLTPLHAAHDRAAVVSQFPLTNRCCHDGQRSAKVLRAVALLLARCRAARWRPS